MDLRKLTEAHRTHGPNGCQYFRTICPFCEIITREQTDAYVGYIEDATRQAVYNAWNRWDRGFFKIANNTTPETLNSYLAFSCLSRWVQPKYTDLQFTEEEILHHPIYQKSRG